ncbi:hypothetical protein P3T76_009718 [Phytophthora citrophthora]|uniref:Uncharacterized protein n=1 Tax=Phytophthora citrophthora TaxID=4793 RepID=A0AAD9GEF0_9STRA|nr:hypothetical protein P3T76_009718 [Phytophthora citrophthora]
MQDDFPVLTSVRVVCRECLSLCEPLNVVQRIDEFLGTGSMIKACKLGSLRLMVCVAAKDSKSHWGRVANVAAESGRVDIFQWLSDFHADRCDWGFDIMDTTAEFGHLPVVE